MEYRRLGSLEVSVIAMGCNNFGLRFGEEQSAEVVEAALEAGINYFDTSDSYAEGRSEECLGAALRHRRDEAVIATKYDGPPAAVRPSAEASLRRLGVEHLDLFQLHHPLPGVPVEETLGALGELVAEGLVREIGCSNFDLEMLRGAASAGGRVGASFSSIQNDYNLLNRKAEVDVLPECAAGGVAFNAYFPLYHGLLTGKFRRDEAPAPGTRLGDASEARRAAVFSDANFAAVEALSAFSAERGRRLLALALALPLAIPGMVSVIAGASNRAQTLENAAAAEWRLSAEEVAAVGAIVPVDPLAPDTPSRAHGVA